MAPFPPCGQEGGRGRCIPHKVIHFKRVLAVKRVKQGSELLDEFHFLPYSFFIAALAEICCMPRLLKKLNK